MASTSSIESASSFLSLVFLASSALRRWASEPSTETAAAAEALIEQGWMPSPHAPGRLFPSNQVGASKLTSIEVWQRMRQVLANRTATTPCLPRGT
jgi:hypothetical protein